VSVSLPEQTTPKRERPSWLTFILFVVAGFGLFLVGTGLLGIFAQDANEYLLMALGLVSLACFGGVTWWLGLRPQRITLEDWGIRPFRWDWHWLWMGVGISLLFLPLRAAIGAAVEWLLRGNLEGIQARSDLLMSGSLSLSGFLLSVLGVAILVPIAEEIYFRGLLHGWLVRHTGRFWLRALVSSGLFALAHIDSLGVVASSFILGVISAWFYEKTRSILSSLIIHMTTNGVAILLLYAAMAAQQGQ
jgi:hypothetical protein